MLAVEALGSLRCWLPTIRWATWFREMFLSQPLSISCACGTLPLFSPRRNLGVRRFDHRNEQITAPLFSESGAGLG